MFPGSLSVPVGIPQPCVCLRGPWTYQRWPYRNIAPKSVSKNSLECSVLNCETTARFNQIAFASDSPPLLPKFSGLKQLYV